MWGLIISVLRLGTKASFPATTAGLGGSAVVRRCRLKPIELLLKAPGYSA